MRAHFVLAFALMLGCTAHYVDGRYACTTDGDCPPGLSCFGDRCSRAAPDGAVGTDAAVLDTGPMIDANCGTFGCATIRATNAWAGGPNTPSFMLNDVVFPQLNYGQTSADMPVPLTTPSTLTLTIMGFGASMEFSLPSGAASYTVVISEPSDSSSMSPTVTLLGNNFAGELESTRLRFASVIHGGGTFGISADGDMSGMITDVSALASIVLDDATRGPLLLSRSGSTIAAFDSSTLNLARMDGSGYYIVFAGRTDRSLLAPDGLRMILTIPSGANVRQSTPLVWLLNGYSTPIDLCGPSGTAIDTVMPGDVDGPFAPASTGSGAPFDVRLDSGTPCDPSAPAMTVGGSITPGPARFLLAVMPDAMSDGAVLTVVAQEASDPGLQDTATTQSIRFANELRVTAALGAWSGSFMPFAGVGSIDSGTAATTYVATTAWPLTAVAFRASVSPVQTWEFGWGSATSPVAFAVPSVTHADVATLWEVAAPYGQPWTAVSHPSTATH